MHQKNVIFDIECNYWYFKDIDCKYEPYLCNGCHDLMQKSINFNDVAIVSVKGRDYKIHLLYIYEQRWCNKYNEKFYFKWKKWVTINFFIIYKIGWNNLLSNKQRNNTK